jgi:hypothetical protein
MDETRGDACTPVRVQFIESSADLAGQPFTIAFSYRGSHAPLESTYHAREIRVLKTHFPQVLPICGNAAAAILNPGNIGRKIRASRGWHIP